MNLLEVGAKIQLQIKKYSKEDQIKALDFTRQAITEELTEKNSSSEDLAAAPVDAAPLSDLATAPELGQDQAAPVDQSAPASLTSPAEPLTPVEQAPFEASPSALDPQAEGSPVPGQSL